MNTGKGQSNSNKGFALILTLVLTFSISSMISTFLLISLNQSTFSIERLNRKKAFYIASSETARITRSLPSGPFERSDSLLGGEIGTEVSIEKGFVRILISGNFRKEKVSILSEYGSRLDSTFSKTAAIIQSTNTPQTGGWIEENIKTNHPLPPLNISIIKNKISLFSTALKSPYQADTGLFSPQVFDDAGEIPNKEVIYANDMVFFKEDTFDYPKTIISTSDIVVENGKLKGLTLIAQGDVIIQQDSELKNVSIFSPASVVLSGYSHFSGEIISQQEIRVGDFASVGESSVLICEGRANKIKFTESAIFSGTVISIGEQSDAGSKNNLITIGESAECRGLIYSTGKVALKGKLKGLVCAHSFYGRNLQGDYGNVIEGNITSGIPHSIVISSYLNTKKRRIKTWKML